MNADDFRRAAQPMLDTLAGKPLLPLPLVATVGDLIDALAKFDREAAIGMVDTDLYETLVYGVGVDSRGAVWVLSR